VGTVVAAMQFCSFWSLTVTMQPLNVGPSQMPFAPAQVARPVEDVVLPHT
jgi:hypothetical protein